MTPDLAPRLPRAQRVVEDSWGAVANVQFTGWGPCPPNTGGMLVVNLRADPPITNATPGYLGSDATHKVNIEPGRGDFFGAAFPHEFGHVLGFSHEMSRPDFVDEMSTCSEGKNNQGSLLQTPPDRDSIMASTGYCQDYPNLSYWDRKGIQNSVYGRRKRFVRDGSPDGNFMADLMYFRASDSSMFMAASNGTGFDVTGFAGPGEVGTDKDNFYNGDFNGDQIFDVGFFNSVDNSFQVAISTAHTTVGPDSGVWVAPGTFGHSGGRHYVGDFNGDGSDDLGFFEPSTDAFHVSLSTGTGFGAAGSGIWIAPGQFGSKRDNFFPADYDGDGITDLGYFEDQNNTFYVSLSTGSSFGGAGSGMWVGPNTLGNSGGRYYVGDYNGDKKEDLGYFEPVNRTFHVSLSSGSGFFAAGSGQWVDPGAFGSDRDNFFPADFDGDGAIDLGYLESGNNSFYVSLSTKSGFAGPGSGQWLAPNAMGQVSGGRFYVSSTRRR